MRADLQTGDVAAVFAGAAEDVEDAVTKAMNGIADGLKADLREQVTAVGLGRRLANTWRGVRYPRNRPSMNSAAYVWSRAPDIIDAFDRGATIRTVNGRKYLAIPTANVPARRRGMPGKGSKMSPAQVEDAFNQDLKFARTKTGKLIAYVNVIGSRGRRGYRVPKPGQRGRGARSAPVVMFVLVRQVHLAKRLDIDGAADRWADRVPGAIAENMRAT